MMMTAQLVTDVEESIVVIVGVAMREDIVSGQAILTSRWHKYNDRLRRRVLNYGQVGGIRHCDHKGWEVRHIEAL